MKLCFFLAVCFTEFLLCGMDNLLIGIIITLWKISSLCILTSMLLRKCMIVTEQSPKFMLFDFFFVFLHAHVCVSNMILCKNTSKMSNWLISFTLYCHCQIKIQLCLHSMTGIIFNVLRCFSALRQYLVMADS